MLTGQTKLTGLSIRDFVLVRALDLDLGGGFSALTGETLKGYIRARRLSLALKQLLGTERRIIEIAVDCGCEPP